MELFTDAINPFYGNKKYFDNQLSEFVFYSKYSRYRDDLGRRETWSETVDRVVSYLEWLSDGKLDDSEYDRIHYYILNMKVMPSMRLMAMAGEAAKRNPVSIFNCSATPIDNLKSFSEIMYLSMNGVGVGFSVERRFVDMLPAVDYGHTQPRGIHVHVVPDSTEGWCKAFELGIRTWFNGFDVEFDFSKIRPAGAPLKTKGGTASGSQPLEELMEFTREMILGAQGRKLTSVEVYDIVCKIADCVVMGGVRRSAALCLFDYDDNDMLTVKNGPYWENRPWRANANNSAVWPEDRRLTQEEVNDFFDVMDDGYNGEPGIFSRYAAKKTMPIKRNKEYEFLLNPCVTGDTLVAVADGRGAVPIKELAECGNDVPVYTINDNGKITVRRMRNPRITGKKDVYRVTFSDGSHIDATRNHKFMTKDGEYRRVDELSIGDALHVMHRYQGSMRSVTKSSKGSSSDYVWINNGQKSNMSEHRLVAEYHGGKIAGGYVVHHIDFNSLNNNPNNLAVMTKTDHDELHRKFMLGDNNPMRRAFSEWNDDKWDAYRKKMSQSTSGEKNGRFSGFSDSQILEHAIAMCRQLGRRFTSDEWICYAREIGLPQSFSDFRNVNSILELGVLASEKAGIENSNLDVRTQKKLIEYTSQGYTVRYNGGKYIFTNICEKCGREFDTLNRENTYCSVTCNDNAKARMKSGQMKYFNERKFETRNLQARVYNDLEFSLGRTPMKKEWVDACRSAGVSFEISRKSSPFRNYKELQQYAADYNHIVCSIEYVGVETVYNGTVDDYHNFFVGGFIGETKDGKEKMSFVNNMQCGEIILRPRELCNLSSVVARPNDTLSTLCDKIEVATMIGTIQSMATKYNYLDEEWEQNGTEERLLGVDITGQFDCPAVRNEMNLITLKSVANLANSKYARLLGISKSASITTVKPSGNSGVLLNVSSGAHPRWSKYYKRNVRVNVDSPLFEVLRASGIDMVKESDKTYVVGFAIKSPDGAMIRKDLTAQEHLKHWMIMKRFYTEHNVSCTIYYGEDEKEYIKRWIMKNQSIISGISFLPRDDNSYKNAPYVEISKAEYERMIDEEPIIDYSMLQFIEGNDMTEAATELSCMAGQCDLQL